MKCRSESPIFALAARDICGKRDICPSVNVTAQSIDFSTKVTLVTFVTFIFLTLMCER